MKKIVSIYIIIFIIGVFSLGSAAKAEASGPFQVIDLRPGWNIISTPRVLLDHEFSIGETSTNLDIFLLNPNSVSGWQTMQEAGQSEFQPLFAYFINNKTIQDQTLKLIYDFDLTPAERLFQRTLYAGWNIIGIASPDYAIREGFSTTDLNNPSNILSSISDSVSQVVDFTAGQEDLDSVRVGDTWSAKVVSQVNDLNDFRELKGYGVFINNTTDNYIGSQNINDNLEFSSSISNPVSIYSDLTSQTLFNFQISSLYDISINSMIFRHSGTGDKNNITDFRLYDIDSNELLGATNSINGDGNLVFSGLEMDLVSGVKEIKLVGDVSSSAIDSETHIFSLEDVVSDPDVDFTGLPINNSLSVIGEPSLIVSSSSSTPAASTYSVGTSNFTFAKFDLTSTGEDMLLSQFNVYFSTDTSSTSTYAATADVNNFRLYDGSTLLASDNTISSGYANFNTNLTVAKNTTKTLTVVADIPAGSAAVSMKAWIIGASDITATGKDSGADITVGAENWNSVSGTLMTKGAPGLTITAASVPAATTYIKNSTGALVTTLYFTANTDEDLRITRIRIAGDATDSSTSGVLFTQIASNIGALDVKDMVGNVKLYNSSTQIGSTVTVMSDGTNYDYADFTGLSLTIPKGTTKQIDVKLDVIDSTNTAYYFFGVATNTDVVGSGYNSGTALTSSTIILGVNGEIGNSMTFGSTGTLIISADPDKAISATYVAGDSRVTMGSWKFTASSEVVNLSMLKFDVNHSSAAVGTSIGYAGALTTTVATTTQSFNYSLNDAAAATCSFATTTASYTSGAALAAEIATDCGLTVSYSIDHYVVSSTTANSIEITDAASNNAADDLKLGLKYGGTETVGRYAGSSQNVGAVYLYDGSTLLGTSYIVSNTVTFNLPTGSEVSVPIGNKVLTLKVDFSAYTSLVEGSTLKLTLGDTTPANDVNYITAKGASSGTTLIAESINSTSAIGALATNEMWLYATKPVLSLNASSPSGAKVPSASQEVFRFDVTNPSPSVSLNVNAIRFAISNSATAAGWDKTYNLYKSTDLTTVIGIGVSYANATSTDTTGWVTIYPTVGYTVGANSTVTYVLKADTSAMNVTTGNDLLSVSIEDANFYWDDGLVANANQKVSGLPVQGNTLSY